MGFKVAKEDVIEGVAYAAGMSAEELLNRIGSDYYEVEIREDERDVHAYDQTVYRVTIKIEPVEG
jgi:predicted DsbA family dithiol-disulfide isomerase